MSVSHLSDHFKKAMMRDKWFNTFSEKGMVIHNQGSLLITQRVAPLKESLQGSLFLATDWIRSSFFQRAGRFFPPYSEFPSAFKLMLPQAYFENQSLFPKNQYGRVVSWELMNDKTLSAEYLHGAYNDENRDENGQVQEETDLINLQLGVGF